MKVKERLKGGKGKIQDEKERRKNKNREMRGEERWNKEGKEEAQERRGQRQEVYKDEEQ